MDKPIISLWGLGPSYRNRIKFNILEAISMGYDNMMDYVILTDYPEDFNEFAKQNDKIKAIININEVRKDYPWSAELEYVPVSTTDSKAYGEEYMNNLRENKYFSYSLHRFSFPTIAELGYNKIVFMDGDVKLRYDKIVSGELTEEQFWTEFDTPVNSMKGCAAETGYIDEQTFQYNWMRAVGLSQSLIALQLCSILIYELHKTYGSDGFPLITHLPITEGPFRYYHLESPQKVKNLFDVWNECIRMVMSDVHFRRCQQCGGYMLCDYIPVAAANIYCGIKVLDFPNTVYNRQIYFEDRYFIPPAIPGIGGQFTPANSQEEFLQNNQEIKQILDKGKAWPHVELS